MGCGSIESVIAVVDGSALEKGRAILLEPRPASKAAFGLPHSLTQGEWVRQKICMMGMAWWTRVDCLATSDVQSVGCGRERRHRKGVGKEDRGEKEMQGDI